MKIFISYRRDDSAGYAGRLFDYLAAHFGGHNVFMDIDTIEPGEDFRRVVQTAVGTCDVVLVMIGKQWLSIRDSQGHRRLEDPRDWVRMEIAGALVNPKVRVIPVLVREAEMPGVHELPTDLKELSWRNAIELSDTRFQHDVNKLIGVIERVVSKPQQPLRSGQIKANSPRFWGLLAGLGALGLFFCIVGYLSYMWIGSRLNTPNDGTMPATPPAQETAETAMWTATSSIATSTVSPSATPDSFTVAYSPAVIAVDRFFRGINEAQTAADLVSSWELESRAFQQIEPAKGDVTDFQKFWLEWKVQYELYDCGSNTVATAQIYYPRNPNSTATPLRQFYQEYTLVQEDGQLKIDSSNRIASPGPSCRSVILVP